MRDSEDNRTSGASASVKVTDISKRSVSNLNLEHNARRAMSRMTWTDSGSKLEIWELVTCFNREFVVVAVEPLQFDRHALVLAASKAAEAEPAEIIQAMDRIAHAATGIGLSFPQVLAAIVALTEKHKSTVEWAASQVQAAVYHLSEFRAQTITELVDEARSSTSASPKAPESIAALADALPGVRRLAPVFELCRPFRYVAAGFDPFDTLTPEYIFDEHNFHRLLAKAEKLEG